MPQFKAAIECLDAFKASMEGVALSDADITSILESIQRRADTIQNTGKNISPTRAVRQAAKEVQAEQQISKAIEERNRLLMAEKRSEVVAAVKNWIEQGGTAADGLKAIMEGFRRDVRGAFRSLDAMIKEQTRKDFGGLVRKMQKHPDFPDGSLYRDFQKNTHSDDVMRELDGRSTGNKRARAIADTIIETRAQQVLALNENGGWIQFKKNYVAAQEHDWKRIRDAGRDPGARGGSKSSVSRSYQAWKSKIYYRLDHQAMFKGMSEKEIDKALRETHRDIVTRYNGQTAEDGLTTDGAMADVDIRPVTSSLAKQVSKQRHLIFNSSEDWWAYHKEFGTAKTFSDAVQQEVVGRSKKIGVMTMFGPNPELTLRGILDDLRAFVRDRDDAADQALALDPKQVQNAWYDSWLRATGFGALHGLERTKFGINTAIAVLRTSKLGGVAITSFVLDRMAAWRGLVARGMGGMESFSRNILKGSEGNKDLLRDQLFAMEGVMERTIDRFGFGGLDARNQRWTNKFFGLIGMNWVNDDNKATVASMLSFFVGRQTNKSFDAIDAVLQKDLKQAGIEAAEWDVIRRAKIIKGRNGEEMLFPSEIQQLDDDAFHSILQSQGKPLNARNVRKARKDLTDSYGIYLSDQTDSIVLTPGLTEQRQLAGGVFGTQGTQEGTIPNLALKLLTQFRSFPLAYMNRFANRALHHAPAHANQGMQRMHALKSGITDNPMWYLGNVASLAIGAYLVMDLKSMLRGQGHINIHQDNPEKQMQLFRRIMLTSGSVGIVGDLFFDEYDQSFNAASKRILGGPAGELIDGTFSSLSALMDGEPGKAGEQLWKTGRKNLPFANAPIIGDGINYLLLDAIQDMVDPGSVEERNQRIRRLRLETTGALFGPGAR